MTADLDDVEKREIFSLCRESKPVFLARPAP
jgi:hypothetical protein